MLASRQRYLLQKQFRKVSLHDRLDPTLDLRYKLLPQCAKRIATR